MAEQVDCSGKCYLCGGKKFRERHDSVRDKPGLKVLECTSCGLVFLSSFDHIKEGAEFYENSMMHGEKIPDLCSWLNETLRDDDRRFQYLKQLLPNRSLLDFGCGPGGFLIKAKKMTSKAHGVEVERRLADHHRSYGLTVFESLSEIKDNSATSGLYDIITMFHVLEHIPDPRSILTRLSDILADDGQILVEVPNADDALLSLYRCRAFSNFTYWSCHLFLFTNRTLEMLFTQANLHVNYITQIQRYPLSNHLYWLAEGRPGGHQNWHFLDSPELSGEYEKRLAAMGKCDTILASVQKQAY